MAGHSDNFIILGKLARFWYNLHQCDRRTDGWTRNGVQLFYEAGVHWPTKP